MQPVDLKSEQFKSYSPEARKLVTQYLGLLRQLPLSFVPSVLREIIDYDFKFPIERQALERELKVLSSLSSEQTKEWFSAFAQIRLSSQLEHSDWVNAPAQFVEQLSAYLWTTHQLDAFRSAATVYANQLRSAAPPTPPPVHRLGISIIGQGVTSYDGPLFRKLRAHGAYFSRVKPESGLKQWIVIPCSPQFLTTRLNQRGMSCSKKCDLKSIGPEWALKRCARFSLSCVRPMSD